MDAATTSLAPANSTRGEWARFGAFLKRPTLPARAPLPRLASLVAILRLMLLDFAMMGVLLGTAAAVMATGVSLPQTALAGMEIGAEIVFAVVVIAPLGEEIAFRSWLSGRPGHLLGLLAAIPAALLAAAAMTLLVEGSLAQIWSTALVAIGAAAVATCAVVVWLRRHDAIGWFARLFPALFWLSTLAFSLVHLFNFPADQLAMALPLVLPQFVIGAILGYTRVTYGLWASILLHALHNGAFISLVLLASSAG